MQRLATNVILSASYYIPSMKQLAVTLFAIPIMQQVAANYGYFVCYSHHVVFDY